MSENHDNSTISNKDTELERTSSIHQKVRYNHDQKKFIKVFPELIQEVSTLGPVYQCNLERDVLWQGKIYPTAFHICFYGKIFTKAAKVTIHFKDITQIEKRSTVGRFPNAIRINTANIEYVFSSFLKRDVTYQAFCDAWHRVKSNNEIPVGEPLNPSSHSNQPEVMDAPYKEINRLKKSSSMDQIDESVFNYGEIKKFTNEEDVNMLSQSYPDQSPIENIAQSHNQNDYDLGNVSEPMSPQLVSEGFQNKMLDNIYNIDTKGLHQLLFEDNSKFLYDVYQSANNDNIKMGLWKKDARTNLKERIIMYNSLNKALFSSRGNILTEEKQKFLRNDKDNFFIESEIKILNINYSDYFKIICKYFIIAEREDYSRLLITFEIKFNKKLALSDKIEKTMLENYTKLFTELENHLNKSVKKSSNEEIKAMNMNSVDELNNFTEPLASTDKLTTDFDGSSCETLNDKKPKSDYTAPFLSEKLDDGMEKPQLMYQFFNTKIFRTSLFNYILDAIFLIINILFQLPSFLIHITNSVISLFKQRDQQKHGGKKRSNKDEKKILTSAPYLIIVLGFLLFIGTIITFSNAYYASQLKEMEELIKNKQAHKINPSLLTKFSEDLSKASTTDASDERDIIQSILGTSYERYNNIYEKYSKQKDKHAEDFNLSYLRLNKQLELMNQKFDVLKTDIDTIVKDFSSEGLMNLIKELETTDNSNNQ